MGKSCDNCLYGMRAEDGKLCCTYAGICHTPDGYKTAWTPNKQQQYYAELYARGQVPDRIKDNLRWIDDAILARMKEQANWPAGTEVIIYCHDCDRETVTAEIERKGYKVVHYVSCDQDRILDYAIQKGQYLMAQKVPVKWDKLPADKSLFTLPNDYHVPSKKRRNK
jgi:hypothetical protein